MVKQHHVSAILSLRRLINGVFGYNSRDSGGAFLHQVNSFENNISTPSIISDIPFHA
jgi:hypothetical protein